MNIMPPPQPSVCEMPLNAVTDCVVVESLRCPYCLAAVEIRQGDNWTSYWCEKHGAIEHPISFSDSALADGCVSTAPDVTPGVCPPWHSRRFLLCRRVFSQIFPDAPDSNEPFSGHKSDNKAVGCIARGFEW